MTRQNATRGATQMGRDMAGNGSPLASVKRAIAPATRCLRTATRHNKKYGPGTILTLIALAASSGASAGGCPGLREHAARRRGRVSSMRIPDGCGREAPHTMITRRRKKREGDGPEGKYIAFASNNPSLDPDAPCPRRWGIEINYKMPRQTRMRTPGRDEHVRIFCFVVSLMGHNARVMLHSDRRAGGDGRRIPKMTLSSLTLLEFCLEYGVRPWLQPPRKPPP